MSKINAADILDKMKLTTQMTGQLYDAQIQTLKGNAVLLFGHPVTITIAPTEAEGLLTQQIQGVVIFHTSSTPDHDKEVIAAQVVDWVLGRGWHTKVSYDDNRDSAPAASSKPAKSNRKKRVRRVPQKRKASTKSKHRP